MWTCMYLPKLEITLTSTPQDRMHSMQAQSLEGLPMRLTKTGFTSQSDIMADLLPLQLVGMI